MTWTHLDQKKTTGTVKFHNESISSLTSVLISVWNKTESVFFTKTGAWPTPQSPHSYSVGKGNWSDCILDMPKDGMIVNAVCYPLRDMVSNDLARTCECYWLTPKASSVEEEYETYLKRMQASSNPKNNSKTRPGNLLQQVKDPHFWPTPRAGNPGSRPNGQGGKILAEEVKIAEGLWQREIEWIHPEMWPTPKARDHKDSGSAESTHQMNTRQSPSLAVVACHQNGGQLNPTWVECLMGFPMGWSIA